MRTIIGISLIEMMLGLTLSMMIASIVTDWYIAAYKIDAVQNALSSIEENQLIVSQYLRADLQTAGFIGCAKLTDEFPLMSYPPYLFNASNFIEGVGANRITIRSMNTQIVSLIAMKTSSMIEVNAGQTFKKEDILVISDCEKAELIKIKNIVNLKNAIQIETESPLHYTYTLHAEIATLQVNTYYIGKTSRKTLLGESIYALYRSDITGHIDELVEGVNEMQIHFVKQNRKLVGVELIWQLHSIGVDSLQKEVPLYVALRER